MGTTACRIRSHGRSRSRGEPLPRRCRGVEGFGAEGLRFRVYKVVVVRLGVSSRNEGPVSNYG